MTKGLSIVKFIPHMVFAIIFVLIIIGMGNALSPLLFSAALAYLVFPIIKKLESYKIRRSVAVLFVFFCILTGFTLFLFGFLPYLAEQTQFFLQQLPHYLNSAILLVTDFFSKKGILIAFDKPLLLTWLHNLLPKISLSSATSFLAVLKNGIGSIWSGLLFLLNLCLFPLFFFYVINDYENIRQEIISMIPTTLWPKIQIFLGHCNVILSGYIRGQLLVALILALLYSLGLGLAGLSFGFLIGLIAGLLSIIPYVGFFIGFATSILVWAATDMTGLLLTKILVVFIVIQLVEGFWITPKLVGNKVGLSHLMTIVALIIGGNLAGFLGIILAIPVAAILKYAYQSFKKNYIRSV